MAAEFKIGRLRFSWKGVWTPATIYARDDVVSYQGKTYVCLLPNTSDATSFYNDLYYVTQTGASTPYWNMIVDGKTFVTANGGGWQTGQAYSLGNIVAFGGVVYYCNTKHTSTDFASQASYWTQYTEFNAWRSVGWLPNNAYGRNDVVKYGGIVYKCITNHTSAATTALGLEANQSAWTIIDSGVEYKGTWTSSTRYKNKDVVKYGPDLWIANSGHTSVAPVALNTVITTGTAGQFSYTGGLLVVGQAITISGQLASTATGSISGYSGNTTTYYVSATDGSTTFTLSDTYAHAIAGTNQLTTVAGTLTGLTVSINGFDQSKWAIWMPGFQYAGSWNTGTIYQPGDTVSYGGYTYYSKTANNIGNTPSVDATDWGVLTQGFNFRGEWGSATSYRIGDVVRRHGIFFDAVADNTAQDPSSYSVSKNYSTTGSSGTVLKLNSVSGITIGMNVIGTGFSAGQTVINIDNAAVTVTLSAVNDTALTDMQPLSFVGVNYINWKVVIPGRYWTKTWIAGITYTVGDLVVWQNGTYVCVQTHQAQSGALSNRPDTDTTNTYWIFYIPHARKNAMNTVGDLEYYSSTTKAYTALPIGTDQYTLKAVASANASGTIVTAPSWNKINQVGAVYYVSSKTGIDRADYGTTWDQPWKTISYACNFIGAGTIYPYATANIIANKTWLTAEMYYWMISQKAASANGFTPSSVFDQTKTIRDAGYVIDALVYDMSRGGNSQIVAATLAYFAFGSSTTIINSTVLAELPYFIAALNQLGTLVQAVLANTVAGNGAVYQTANSVTPVVYQKTGVSAELGSPQVASSLLSILTTTLTSQSTALVPAPNSGTTASIFVKTGNYFETLPITVPENTAIIGDELRSVTVAPAISLTMQCTSTTATTNLVTVNNTSQLVNQMAVQFANPTITSVIGTNAYYGFGGVVPGTTYYVVGSTITATQFKITALTGTYYSVAGTNITATGTSATFNVTPVQDGTYTVTVAYGGNNYLAGDTIKILSSALGIAATTAGSFVSGFQYTITSVGTTDFTAIGAVSNTVGLRFTATGAGSGTGTATTTANDISITVNTVNSGAILTLTALGSTIFPLVTGGGSIALGTHMAVYAGDCIKDMFRLRNGTGLRNMTLTGLLGTLSNPDTFYIQKPTGGAYAALDPGAGPNDTTAWIFRRSPYVQNVTSFGNGCTGLKIDGTLHNGGNKSIVCNDFTHIISDGIGIWCTGPSALTEAVSVFSYYGYCGYLAEAGGRIRATNGNTSYGTYGVIAEGYDLTETPATGIIFNQSSQVQAAVQSAFGSQAQLVRLTFSNSGSAYSTTTTNLLNFSNNFLGASWVNDSNVSFNKNTTALTGLTEAWSITGNSNGPDGSYVYQNISIPAAGAVYSNLPGTNIVGNGGTGANNPALFNVTVTATAYVVTVSDGGAGYVNGNTLYIAGSSLGGIDNINDCIITITGVSGNVVTGVSSVGTVPLNSALGYTLSAYVKKGTSSIVDLYATFSGSNNATSSISYNFDTGVITTGTSGVGMTLLNYGAINQQLSSTDVTAGWIRIWMSVYDTTGLNTQLQYRLYPRGYNGSIGQYTFVYGAQTELSKSNYAPSFYLEVTNTSKYTAYANYNITGAGTGVVTVGNEIRSSSVFQARVVTDSNGITGGAGYLTASNNSQAGTPQYVQLSQADTNTNGNYTGMRVFIQGGTGAGQYGYISYYNSGTKVAWLLKESFAAVPVTATASSGSLMTTTSTASLYLNQPVQFIPTYYTTSVSSTSLATTTVTTAIGGTTNTFTVASTVGLVYNQAVTFSGNTFSAVSPTQTYYIFAIIDSSTIQITNQPFGTVWQLNSATGSMTMNFSSNTSYLQGATVNMVVNYPIQFTGTALGGISVGTVYYINEVVSSNSFTISSTLITLTVTASTAGIVQGSATAYWGTNYPRLVMADTSSLVALNPVVFSSPMHGGLTDSQKYYIAKIINGTSIAVASTILTVTITKFEAGTNLVTASSTAGFQQDYPIRFVGAAINAITPETTYYISAVNNSTTFTITTLPGQQVVQCTATTTGYMTATTCPQAAQVTTLASGGSMTLSSTSKKSTLTLGIGAMNATFSTQLFGNPQLGQTYYIQSIPDSLHFSVSLATGTVSGTSTSASPFGLADKTGSMSVAAVGWDHINPGTPIVPALDSSSQYYIEPRTIFSAPSFIQTVATSVVALSVGTTYITMAHGNNYWIALASSGTVAAGSSDGSTWTSIALPNIPGWSGITYGNGYWIIIQGGGVSNSTFAISKSNGAGWRTVSSPPVGAWNNITYGNGTFVVTASNTNNALYSTTYGTTWTTATLPTSAPWSCLTWGGSGPNNVNGGRFVTLANGVKYTGASTQSVVTTGSGATFDVVVTPSSYTLTIASGGNNYTANDTIKILGTSVGGATPANDILITVLTVNPTSSNAVTSFSFTGTPVTTTATIAAYSATGATWVSVTLPASGAWSSVTYGNGLFVAVATGTGATPVYSQDGQTWYAGNNVISADKVSYGQGVFVAVSSTSTQAYTSENGSDWKARTVSNDGYSAIAFGFVGASGATQYNGVFATLAGRNTGSVISAGCQTKARASIASNIITSLNLFEPGSGYTVAPMVSFVDPNVTTLASISPRIANGVLSSPTFANRGSGYNTNSTAVIVSGNGYSDQYQTGLQVILNNLTRLPSPGDNLTITGVSQIYKVTSAFSVFNTVAPNLEANVSVSPSITTANSTANGTVVSIRSKYSQARLTNHDFLNIGYGDFTLSNYPNFPVGNYVAAQNNQSVEANYGRVFFTSTDQDGNFKVGNLFGVQQATGIVTLSASQFGLTGLSSLSLGGIAVGGSSVVVNQFSTDSTFTANSDSIIPTQKAIKKYLTDRLSAGGSNTFTGQLTAGTVVVGGPNYIRSTIPSGITGSNVKFTAKANFVGQNAAVDGNMAAFSFYARNAFRGRQ